jgi:hypothetical protein
MTYVYRLFMCSSHVRLRLTLIKIWGTVERLCTNQMTDDYKLVLMNKLIFTMLSLVNPHSDWTDTLDLEQSTKIEIWPGCS